ncbi:MAG: hypothetical protein ACJAVI_005795 [Candidatus Azotimanducaceae bacterium]|jgi:hypothetical protein
MSTFRAQDHRLSSPVIWSLAHTELFEEHSLTEKILDRTPIQRNIIMVQIRSSVIDVDESINFYVPTLEFELKQQFGPDSY